MQSALLNPRLSATAAPRSLRQARRDRQANRAIIALLGLTILAVLLARITATVVANAKTAEDDRLAAISAALPPLGPSNRTYVIDADDNLLIEGGAELPAEVAGEHLVGSDGTINLGTGNLGAHGLVYVAGLTLAEAKLAVEDQLKTDLAAPQLSITMHAFNCKVYYVIAEGAGLGHTLIRVPITGHETVLDALAQVNGLSRLSSKNVWIARPAPGGGSCDQILPVNWYEITKSGGMASNYQVLPGDRIFIAEDKMIALDNWVDRISSPIERIFGFSLLGTRCGGTQTSGPLELLLQLLGY